MQRRRSSFQQSVGRYAPSICTLHSPRGKVEVNVATDKQISPTYPDARRMKTRGTGILGCNMQTAVDAKHHLIVAHEVTNNGLGRDRWP
jgi:hypothetical protein